MFTCWLQVIICVALAVLYVSSLYVWDSSKGRDHPSTIKKRCISVAFMTIISPLFVKFSVSQESFLQYDYPKNGSEFSLLEVMGIRWDGLLNAAIFPLLLTALFYTGPIILWLTHEYSIISLDPRYLYQLFTSPVWLRNQVIAPFSEEWTFRACLLPIILQCMQPITALLVSPLFFGLAHIHHAVERLRVGVPVAHVICGTLFQCMFTSVFGIYSAYLFMKTGHFVAPFLTHAFCNLMGFPDITELIHLPLLKKLVHILLHVAGIVFWYLALTGFTENCWYSPVLNYFPDL